jgi:hypothetical protein
MNLLKKEKKRMRNKTVGDGAAGTLGGIHGFVHKYDKERSQSLEAPLP